MAFCLLTELPPELFHVLTYHLCDGVFSLVPGAPDYPAGAVTTLLAPDDQAYMRMTKGERRVWDNTDADVYYQNWYHRIHRMDARKVVLQKALRPLLRLGATSRAMYERIRWNEIYYNLRSLLMSFLFRCQRGLDFELPSAYLVEDMTHLPPRYFHLTILRCLATYERFPEAEVVRTRHELRALLERRRRDEIAAAGPRRSKRRRLDDKAA